MAGLPGDPLAGTYSRPEKLSRMLEEGPLSTNVPAKKNAVEAEKFFSDLPSNEWDPVTVQCDNRTHPDTVLRRLGVIECRGKRGTHEAYLDGKLGQWVAIEDNDMDPVPITDYYGDNKHQMVNDITRYDKVPGGVIQVLGTFPDMPCRDADGSDDDDDGLLLAARGVPREPDKDDALLTFLLDRANPFNPNDLVQRIKQEKEKRVHADGADVRVDEVESDDGNNVPVPIDDAPLSNERQKLFAQYLGRGVVDAAKRTTSCIVAPGTGRMALHLASGVEATQDKGVTADITSQIRNTRTLLIGVTAHGDDLTDEAEERTLNAFFTHHVVVERSTGATDFTLWEDYVIEPLTEATHYGNAKIADDAAERTKLAKKKRAPAAVPDAEFQHGCRGFRCAHCMPKDKDGKCEAVIPDVVRNVPRHCRFRLQGDAQKMKAAGRRKSQDKASAYVDEEDELDDVYGDEETWVKRKLNAIGGTDPADRGAHHYRNYLRRSQREEEAFLEEHLANVPGEYLRRTCTCGTELMPFDVAKCADCGRYDFQHVPRAQKRNRYRYLKSIVDDPVLRTYLAFFAAPITNEPDEIETGAYQTELVRTLASGFSPGVDHNRGLKRPPPFRKKIPVCCVVMGGEPALKYQIMSCVQRGYPLMVVEQSGGYAEHLCRIILAVQKIVQEGKHPVRPLGHVPNKGGAGAKAEAGLDEFRRYLSGVDSVTAEILVNGQVEVIRSGMKVSEFTRKIEQSLIGNETLELAWKRYAQWNATADRLKRYYLFWHWLIMILGLLVTGCSVFLTFYLLTSGRQKLPTPFSRDNADRPIIYFVLMLRAAVVVVPLILIAAQAMFDNKAPGPKFVHLNTTANLMLSEIYKYRTRTLEYSPSSVREVRNELGDLVTETPEGLLQERGRVLTESLTDSEVASVTLDRYEGSIPPPHIKKNGDDGFSFLGPDVYCKVRAEAVVARWQCRAVRDSVALDFSLGFSNFFNALGTLIAGAGAFGYEEATCWITMTTAIASAFVRHREYSRAEYMNSKLNVCIARLEQVLMWWTGLGAAADNKDDRDRLVEDCETVVVDEALLWEKVIQTDADAKKNAQEKRKAKISEETRAKKLEEAENHAKLKEIGTKYGVDVTELTQERLVQALKNPSGSKAVMEAIGKLSYFGLAPAQVRPETHREHKDKANPTEAPPPPPLTTNITHGMAHLIMNQETREAIMQRLLLIRPSTSIGHFQLLGAMEAVPELHKLVKPMNRRNVLCVTKALFVEHIVQYVLNKDSWPVDTSQLVFKSKPSRRKLLPSVAHDQDEFLMGERFIGEMITMARTPKIEEFAPQGVLNILKDKDVKAKCRALAPKEMDTLRATACEIWHLPADPRDLTPVQVVALLLDDIMEIIAMIDVDNLHQTLATRVRVWEATAFFFGKEQQLHSFSREQLVRALPASVAKDFRAVSTLQIQKDIAELGKGTAASRIFRLSHKKVDDIVAPHRPGQPLIFHPQGDKIVRERLVLAFGSLDQIMINRMSRGLLLRKLRVCSVFDESCEDVLMALPEEALKFLMSVVGARCNNTTSSRLIDAASTEITSFDARKTLPENDLVKLIRGARELQNYATDPQAEALGIPPPVDVATLTKKQILETIGYRSMKTALQPLDDWQIRELLTTISSVCARTHPLHVYGELRRQLPELASPRVLNLVDSWDAQFVDNFIDAVWQSSTAVQKLLDAAAAPGGTALTVDDILDAACVAAEISEGLGGVVRAFRTTGASEEAVAIILIKLLRVILDTGGERPLSVAFEAAAFNAKATPQGHMCFTSHTTRVECASLLCTLPHLIVHRLLYDAQGARLDAGAVFPLLFPPDAPAKVQEFPHAHHAFSQLQATPEIFVNFIESLITEFTVDGPFRVFAELASRLDWFDLRDIFQGFSRYLLIIYIYEMFLKPGGPLWSVRDTIKDRSLPLIERWIGRRVGDVPDVLPSDAPAPPEDDANATFPTVRQGAEEYDTGHYRMEVLRSLMERVGECEMYACIIDGVRALTEVQMKVMFEECVQIFATSTCGKVLRYHLDAAGALHAVPEPIYPIRPPQWDEFVGHNRLVALLRQRARLQQDMVAHAFDNFDAAAWLSRSYEQQERKLASIGVHSEDDIPINPLRGLEPFDLHVRIFTYLTKGAPVPHAKRVLDNHAIRTERWKRIRGHFTTTGGPNPILDENRPRHMFRSLAETLITAARATSPTAQPQDGAP